MAQGLAAPPPIATLRSIGPAIRVLPAGTRLWRVYFRGGRHRGAWNRFRGYGPLTSARFDHHPPPARQHRSRAILYAAAAGPTCLAEVFQTTRTIDRFAHQPAIVAFDTARPLPLLDLTGAWPTRAGGSMAIASGSRAIARSWSLRIHAAYRGVHGLWYGSSMNGNQPAFALYERSRAALPRAPAFDRLLGDPALYAPLAVEAGRFGYALI